MWTAAAASAANALNPVPGVDVSVDVGILVAMVAQVRRIYGLDDETLTTYSHVAGPIAALAQQVLRYAGRDAIVALLRRFAGRLALKESSKWVPIVGQAVAASLGFAIAKLAGDKIVKDCHELAAAILKSELS